MQTLVIMVATRVARALWPREDKDDQETSPVDASVQSNPWHDPNAGVRRWSGSWRGQQSLASTEFAPVAPFGLRCALEKAHFGSTMDTRSPVSPFIFDPSSSNGGTATASTTTPRPLGRRQHRNESLLVNLFGSNNLTPLNSRFDQEANTGNTPAAQRKGHGNNQRNNNTDRQVRSQEYSPMVVSPLQPIQPLRHSISDIDFALKVNDALSKSDLQPDLIGDFTKSHSLPLITGKHQDLKTISTDTMARLIRGDFKKLDFLVVDCRYPYEYEGGHITSAINIFTKEKLLERFFNENSLTDPPSSTVVIFHCEFSSKRGPKLYRFMRGHDRNSNSHRYPHLNYPEMYILEGGYKAFFEQHKGLCSPENYVTMDSDPDSLRQFQSMKSRSFQNDGHRTRPSKVPRGSCIRSFD